MSESKIKKSALSFPVTFEKVKDFETADDRFTKVKIWLMHLGKNLNNSAFEKSVVDKAIPTLQYIPIMGFVELNDDNEKDFSDHRYIITKDDKGIRRKYMGTPYGVIKSSDDNNAHYEERLCEDGETRTFLVTEGVIWNVLEDGAEIFHRDLVKSQSMELYEKSMDGYEDDDGIFHFTEFSFRAACILGSDYEPAMINSTVEVQFAMTDFVKNLQSELNDKYSAFTKIVNDNTFTEIKMVNENNIGGIETMPNTDFSTVLQQFKDISDTIAQHECVEDRWGDSYPRYYAVDIQENEVIVVDDGSSDESADIVRSIVDSRIIYVYQKNSGVSEARNNGVRYSNGAWVLFLDADDYILPDALLTLVSNIHEDVDVVCGNFYIEKEGVRVIGNLGVKPYKVRNNFRAWFFKIAIPRAGVAIYRKEVLMKNPFNVNYRRYEDAESLLSILRTSRMYYVPDIVMCYSVDNPGLSKKCNDYNLDFIFHMDFVIVIEILEANIKNFCSHNIFRDCSFHKNSDSVTYKRTDFT